jgi:hypothetical protein
MAEANGSKRDDPPKWLRLLAEKTRRAFGPDPTRPQQPPKPESDPKPPSYRADEPKIG